MNSISWKIGRGYGNGYVFLVVLILLFLVCFLVLNGNFTKGGIPQKKSNVNIVLAARTCWEDEFFFVLKRWSKERVGDDTFTIIGIKI